LSKDTSNNSFKDFLKKLIRIEGSPQKISLSVAFGVFWGVFPGTGIIFALVFAAIFRLNKPASVLGCLLTNSWISFVIGVIGVRFGLAVLGVDFGTIWGRFLALCKDFHFDKAFDFVFSKDTLNIFIAYLIASFFISAIAYLLSYVIIKLHRASKIRA
jgi:uncharacterized protein (DUF2062 family)